jgi:gas vesicle protein
MDSTASDNTEYEVKIKKSKPKSDGNALAILGTLLGAAIGAGVALVYTRGSGEQNRADLNKWAHHRLDDLQHKVESIR